MIEALKLVLAPAIAAGILMLLLGFSALVRRFPRAIRVFAQAQVVTPADQDRLSPPRNRRSRAA